MQRKAVVYLIAFAHLDLFWAGSREECLSRGAEVILTALRLLERYPDYRFMIESVNFLDYFHEAYPDAFPRLAEQVRKGRLEVIPLRSILYTQLPSGETLVRNCLTGREWCEHHFGFSGTTASLSDIPGVTPQLPQIAAKSGFTGLLLSHGTPPHTDRVRYAAPDGTEINTYAPIHYGRCRRLFAEAEHYDAMCANEPRIEEELGGVDYPQLCQFGTDLCVIPERVVENFHRWNAEGHRPFHFRTAEEYFKHDFPENARRISGEIPSLWPNVESSWPDLWPQDLPAENAMLLAEFLEAMHGPSSRSRTLLKQAWDHLLDSMDHNQNGIGGAIADAEKKDLKRCARLIAERLARNTAMVLAARIPAPRINCFPLAVFNRLSWRRRELVRARTTLYGPGTAKHPLLRENNFRLIDDQGIEQPFRLVKHLRKVADSIEVEFSAEVPAFGCRTWFLEIAEPHRAPSPFRIDDGTVRDRRNPSTAAGETCVENAHLRLSIERVTGRLSLYDKRHQRFLFVHAELSGREEVRGDYICGMTLTGRTIPAVVESVEIEEDSPVVCRILVRGTLYGMRYEQRLSLPAETAELEVENTIHWKCGSYVRMEQSFPFPETDHPPVIEYGVPFGKVRYPETIYKDDLSFRSIVTPERGNDPDPAIEHLRLAAQWVAFGSDGHFTTIGSDHRLWEFDAQEIRSCMVRGIGYCSGSEEVLADGTLRAVPRPPDGTYTCRYRIQPGMRPECGWELNAPLYPVGVGRCLSESEHLERPSLLPDTTGSGIFSSCVKVSERIPGAIVVRLFEISGKHAELALPEGEWLESDLMERNARPCSGPVVSFSPFEIKTLIRKNVHSPRKSGGDLLP